MNILLWVLQIFLAFHTVMGAVWKFSNSEQSVASLNVIPHGIWLAMSVIELLCALGLILPAIMKRSGRLVPTAAGIVGAEMLLFCMLDIVSGSPDYGHIGYWLVVATFSGFIAYGRSVLKPL